MGDFIGHDVLPGVWLSAGSGLRLNGWDIFLGLADVQNSSLKSLSGLFPVKPARFGPILAHQGLVEGRASLRLRREITTCCPHLYSVSPPLRGRLRVFQSQPKNK